MRSRRVLFLLGLAAALGIGIALRLSTRDQVISGVRVRGLTSDDSYHLRRARFAVAHYPRTILFDPLMNFPEGGVPIWPPLFDVALATPARVLYGPGASAAAVEFHAAWVPLIFAAGSIVLAGLLGQHLLGAAGGVALALFLAVAPGHLLWSQYGHTDQHVAESFFGLLVLLLFLRSRDEGLSARMPTRAQTVLRELWAGVGLTLAVLAWQGAICWGAVIALSLFLESVRTRRSVFSGAVTTLGFAAVLTAGATAAWLGPFRPPFTYISFGFFQPLFLAALAGGTIGLETLLRAARGQLSRREAAFRIAVLAAAGAAIFPFVGDLGSGLLRGLGYVAGTTSEVSGIGGYVSYPRDWLKGIFEARPLLAEGPELAWKRLSAAFFLAPLVIMLWAARSIRGIRPGFHIALAVWGAITLSLALLQRLNTYYAAPLAGLCLLEAAKLCADRFGKTRPARAGLAVAAGLALALPMAPGIRDELRTYHAPGSDLLDTLDWMRRELPRAVEPYDPRLLAPDSPDLNLRRAVSVLAPWSLGHRILYEAEQPVVANNFGYGFLDSIRFFLAESEEEALAIAKRRRVRWVLAADLLPRMNDYASYLNRPPYLQGEGNALRPTSRYFSTLQSRLFDFEGAGAQLSSGASVPPLEHFRLRFRSRSAVFRGARPVAQWKVFEVVE